MDCEYMSLYTVDDDEVGYLDKLLKFKLRGIVVYSTQEECEIKEIYRKVLHELLIRSRRPMKKVHFSRIFI